MDAEVDTSSGRVEFEYGGSALPLSGARLGSYLVLSKLGEGGMGVVYAAYDPALDRKVALKLLRRRSVGERGEQRLRREAQALARLNHPNVVGIHEVGSEGGQLFLVMEFVRGQTLRTWLSEKSRPWQQVLERFLAAGAGLEAAHRAGLIHRDFKPDNVMLGDEGLVRVMDFGLAREAHAVETLEEPGLPLVRPSNGLDVELTQTGARLGTPGYIAPELDAGETATQRADQYSFCVALFEGLYGERPYRHGTSEAILSALADHRAGAKGPRPKVPSWLTRAVVRGLDPNPARRHASMAALLEALSADPAPRRRRMLGLGLGLAIMAGGSWGFGRALRVDAQVCTHARDALVGVWDSTRDAALAEVFAETGLAYAPATWTRAAAHLDAYARDWVEMREQACLATQRGEQSEHLLDLRVACLDGRRSQLGALVEELGDADAKVIESAVEAALALPPVAGCADVDALLNDVPPAEAELASQVALLDSKLIEAEAKRTLGRSEEALVLAEAVVHEAEPLGYEPLLARAWLLKGKLQNELGTYEASEATLERALDAAVVMGMHEQASSAANEILILLQREERAPERELWTKLSGTLARAVGTDEAQASWLHARAELESGTGRYEEARAHQQQAIVLWEGLWGPAHPTLAYELRSLGDTHIRAGEFEEAAASYERALEVMDAGLGRDHPYLVGIELGLGALAGMQSKPEEARAHFERALEIRSSTAPEHPDVGVALNNLGIACTEMGDYAAARGYTERALAIWATNLGSESPQAGVALGNLGNIARQQGDEEAALDYFERALAVQRVALGEEHPRIAAALSNLAVAQLDLGRPAEAKGLYARSLALGEQVHGAEHLSLGLALTGLGKVELELGAPAAALAWLERAHALRTGKETDLGELADTDFALARALWESPVGAGRDRGRARELAEGARAYLQEHGRSPTALVRIERWQQAHP